MTERDGDTIVQVVMSEAMARAFEARVLSQADLKLADTGLSQDGFDIPTYSVAPAGDG